VIRTSLRRLAVFPVLALAAALAGCSGTYDAILHRMLSPADDAYARAQVQALARGEVEGIEAALDPAQRTPGLDQQLAAMTGELRGGRIDSMKVIGYQGNRLNGVNERNVSYELRLSNGWAVASVATRDVPGGRVISGMHVERIPEPLEKTHAFTLAEKSPLHWLFLVLAVVIPLLMLYAVWLVFRMPGRRWPWVLASILGLCAWRLEWTTGQTGFGPVNVQLLGSAFMRTSPYSPWIISISLPLGALWVIARYFRGSWRSAAPTEGPAVAADGVDGGGEAPR
jgi:hypothetical protein